MELKIKSLHEDAKTPHYATGGSAGLDLTACNDERIELEPMERVLIPTGLSMAIPDGYVGLIFPRSSMGYKEGLTLPNCVGVIDSDYRGEIMVAMVNISNQVRVITKGTRIAQLVIIPAPKMKITKAEKLDDTERGEGGFGSTGQ